jgi:anti-sigma regulatory factor (Ser/Thr protein kinase)
MDGVNTSGLWLAPLDTAVFALVARSVDEFLTENGVDGKAGYSARLVIEEIMRNLIQHTPPYATDETAEIVVEIAPERLTVIISDTRPPFDPSSAPELDVDAPLDERRPGGMGIHLVRNMVDELTYERADDRNRLTAVIARE